MSSGFTALFWFEFRRIWSRTTIIVISAAIGIIWLITYGTLNSGIISGSFFHEISIHTMINSEFSYLVPILIILFSSGIVANDVKNNWLRTVFSRPITRQMYLLIKMISVLTSIWIILLLACDLPMILIPLIKGINVTFDIKSLIILHLFYVLISITYLSVTIWLSCFVSGFYNVFIFAIWMVLDSVINPIVTTFFWDSKLILLAADFFFPSGLKETLESLLSAKGFLWENFMFGLSAMFGFLTLSFFNFSKINIDKGSE